MVKQTQKRELNLLFASWSLVSDGIDKERHEINKKSVY